MSEKNQMVKQIVLSTDGIYQRGFLKVAILNRFMKGAVTGFFRRAFYW